MHRPAFVAVFANRVVLCQIALDFLPPRLWVPNHSRPDMQLSMPRCSMPLALAMPYYAAWGCGRTTATYHSRAHSVNLCHTWPVSRLSCRNYHISDACGLPWQAIHPIWHVAGSLVEKRGGTTHSSCTHFLGESLYSGDFTSHCK